MIGSDSRHEYSFKQKDSFYSHCPSLQLQKVIIANPKLGMCRVVQDAALMGLDHEDGEQTCLTNRVTME